MNERNIKTNRKEKILLYVENIVLLLRDVFRFCMDTCEPAYGNNPLSLYIPRQT